MPEEFEEVLAHIDIVTPLTPEEYSVVMKYNEF